MFRWYAVNTKSGHEAKAKRDLQQRIRSQALHGRFGELRIPTERVSEVKGDQRVEVERKTMPGYLFVQMRLDGDTWEAVKGTPSITGFVGCTQDKQEPVPLSPAEVDRMLNIKPTRASAARAPQFQAGQTIRIVDGPMADFQGEVESVDLGRRRLRVKLSIFGRETPVEVSLDQVRPHS